jgi:anaerobic C4-dicarboxylate transporter
MATAIILIQLALVLALIFIGARVGGIGLGIYGMVGVFILVFVFGLKPGNLPIDVMLIIVSGSLHFAGSRRIGLFGRCSSTFPAQAS